jgi:glycosyltransferase involved in cell wall biosynthesis
MGPFTSAETLIANPQPADKTGVLFPGCFLDFPVESGMNRIGTEQAMGKRRLCVVIPVHNEAENLDALVRRLSAAAGALAGWDTEFLFVDDGSTDNSAQKLREIRAGGIPIGYARLSRNFGHQAALCAGMEMAVGDAIITMDSDLQHPPEEIPRMIDAFERGADVVQMVRSDPAAAGAGKGLLSTVFYRIFNHLSDTRIVPNAADFRLLNRQVLDVFLRIPEREKFIRGLIPALGFRQVSLEFHQASRLHGKPAYTFWASLRLARKALFDYSTVPLQFVFWLGMSLSVISFCFGTGHIVWKLMHPNRVVAGFTDVITAIFFLSGCILASVGIVGRYLMMILEQVRGRPAYIVMDHVAGVAISSVEKQPASVGESRVPVAI